MSRAGAGRVATLASQRLPLSPALAVHVSPQRFPYVLSGAAGGGSGPAGVTAGVRGSAGQVVTVVAVDPQGVVRSQSVTLPIGGRAEISL